ncbi:sensor histidine kinase [Microbispora sp. NPDC088329]|uniref:sensor histidine kinase n=1 Tax=Microbispora sp. NPDC088329 TaxID=3154869 RepID=UPI003442FAF5
MSALVHEAGLYGSDDEFLGIAVPFVRDGLDGGEPVMVTTTAGNLELLGAALGDDARRVDYAESAYFGRRTAHRATAFLRYWERNAARGRVRILAEPVWAGRSSRDVVAWRRMESGLNIILAGTGVWMICPYDTRAADRGLVEDALRTHPSISTGGRGRRVSPAYADPARFIGECDRQPLPQAPPGAAAARIGHLHRVRHFAGRQALLHGLPEDRVAMLCVAVHEAARYLGLPLTARVWETFGALVCDLWAGRGTRCDPLAGFTPPGEAERPEDGLWLARQICDYVDIRQEEGGRRIRLEVATSRLQESA